MLNTRGFTLAALLLGIGVVGSDAGDVNRQRAADDLKAAPGVKEAEQRGSLVRLASLTDGVVLAIGTEVKDGEQVPADRLATIKVGDEVRKFRRLKRGDVVEDGQLLAVLDDRLARGEVAIRQKKVAIAEAEAQAANRIKDEAYQRYVTQKRLEGGGIQKATTLEDVRAAHLVWQAKTFEAAGKEGALAVAKLELKQAQTLLEMHEVRSRTRGVVQAIAKHPGEAVKRLETVVVIRLTER